MDFSQLKALAFCVAVLVLMGCNAASKKNEHFNPSSLQVASMIGDAQPGDLVSLPSNSVLGMDSVVVDRTYIAASGRQCRHMRTMDGAPILRVACKGSDGAWSLARDLRLGTIVDSINLGTNDAINVDSTDAINQSLVPSAGSMMLLREKESLPNITNLTENEGTLVDDESEIETVKRTVNVNETLWSFAKRTTGNALNWEVIAQINGIFNAKTLPSGKQLLVPVKLVVHGG